MTTPLNSYSTGTVAVSADGTVVTGTSTIWSSAGNVKPGDLFQSGHYVVPITDVTDDTHFTITPWPGSTLSGASYTIWKVSQQRIVGSTYAQAVDNLVTALDTTGFFVFVRPSLTVPDPSLGDDGQYAFQPTTGAYWLKTGGVWVASGSPAAGYGGTSTTSRAIGTGAKAFTTQLNLAYRDGARIRATSNGDATKWMEGVATYNAGAGNLTIAVDRTNGSGTYSDWNFNVAGEPGVTTVDNIAALRLTSIANSFADTRGYYSPGDGGGSRYVYSASTNPALDDGGSIIAAAGGVGSWVLHARGMVDALQFGVRRGSSNSNGPANAIAIDNLLTYCAANNLLAGLFGLITATTFKVPSNTSILAGAVILGDTDTTKSYACVMEIVDAVDVTITGRLLISGSYNIGNGTATGYLAGIKIWANTTNVASLMTLSGVSVVGARVGWQFGDITKPDADVAGIMVVGGYTFGTPTCAMVIGTQAVVHFSQYNMDVGYGSGTGAFTSIPLIGSIIIGGALYQDGGENVQAVSSTGWNVNIQPITSGAGFPNSYGSFRANNVFFEGGGNWVVASNPNSAVADASRGVIAFANNTGDVTQAAPVLISTASDYGGSIIVNGNNFYSTVVRTGLNISAGSANAKIYFDSSSFGLNMLQGYAGVSGGTQYLTSKDIAAAGGALTGTSGTQAPADSIVYFNASGTFTYTLLPPTRYPGRTIRLINNAAAAVDSASSNIINLSGAATGSILPAAAGKWAELIASGNFWSIVASN